MSLRLRIELDELRRLELLERGDERRLELLERGELLRLLDELDRDELELERFGVVARRELLCFGVLELCFEMTGVVRVCFGMTRPGAVRFGTTGVDVLCLGMARPDPGSPVRPLSMARRLKPISAARCCALDVAELDCVFACALDMPVVLVAVAATGCVFGAGVAAGRKSSAVSRRPLIRFRMSRLCLAAAAAKGVSVLVCAFGVETGPLFVSPTTAVPGPTGVIMRPCLTKPRRNPPFGKFVRGRKARDVPKFRRDRLLLLKKFMPGPK